MLSRSSSEEERREGSEDQYAAWYVFIVKFNKENTEHCNTIQKSNKNNKPMMTVKLQNETCADTSH
jgi:hypothetical protein